MLKKNLKNIYQAQLKSGGDFGYLHSLPRNSIQRNEYQLRVNEWFTGLAKIFKLVLQDTELVNETKSIDYIKNLCLKIIELKKTFETNPNFEDEFTTNYKDKDWLIKLRSVVLNLCYMTLTLPFSSNGYLLNINGRYDFKNINSLNLQETITDFNKTSRFKVAYTNLRLYIDPNSDVEFYYDQEQNKILSVAKKHYWLINGWF